MLFKTLLSLFTFILLISSEVAFGWKIEADKMVISNTGGNVTTHINFRQTYSTIPLVFSLATDTGADSSTLRITNVSTTGFDVYTVEPDGDDGPHAQMSAVPYIAIEAGSHEFPDGTKIVAGTINTQLFQSKFGGASWQSVSLSGFSTTPVILGQIQTRSNERTDLAVPSAVSQPWMTTAIRNVTNANFEIALERSETSTGSISSNETIAYLAIDSGLNSGNHYFASNISTKIEYESIRSADFIKGWDDSGIGYAINFSKTYTNPIVVATKNTRDGGDGGWLRRRDISDSSIQLVVEEDIATDTERSHTHEIAGLLLFSKPFDSDFIYSGQAELVINEVMYQESSTGANNDEFVEFYVTTEGNLNGTIISDQDGHFYRFPSLSVSIGDYVIYHTGNGANSSSGGIHHFYQGTSTIWNNNNDDLLLIKPSKDVTTSTHGTASSRKTFNGIPMEYMAYGRNTVGGSVDAIPTSMHGATVSWTFDIYGAELKDAVAGESIALTPNANDSDKAACWEKSSSGNASDNGCTGYIITRDTDATSYKNSLANANTISVELNLSKTTLTIYDPYNGASNPKAIPSSVIEYIIGAKNDGTLAADNNSIKITDKIPTNTKLCVSNTGYCKAPYFVNGTPSSGLSLASTAYSNDNGVSYSHTPSADVDGADSSITHLRASMSGAFQPKTGATAPNFQLKFRIIVE